MDEGSGSLMPEEEDPSAGWKLISSLILSLFICFCCRDSGSVFYVVLLFFPVNCIIRGILNNSFQKIGSGLLLLLIYPVLKNSVPMLDSKVAEWFSGKNLSSKELRIASGVLFSGIFILSMIVTSLAGKAIPKWEMPEKIHRRVNAVIFVLTLFLCLAGVYYVLMYHTGKIFNFPAAANYLLPIILAGIGIAASCRIINQTLNPPEKNKPSNQMLISRPDTKLSDVAGMSEVKEQIRLRLIEPILHPAKAKKYGLKVGGGVLLYGPPGTGKTFLARAVAGELNLPFFMITSADIFGKYVGESEKNILNLFKEARRNPLSVLFIDELETIFAKRTENIHETTQKVISLILQELDGVDQKKNPILLLGATNTPWRIDEAFLRPGRFDILAFVDLPDLPARLQILKAAFRKSSLPMEDGLLQYIAENTNEFSGADLNGLVSKIQQKAFQHGDQKFTCDLAYEILLKTTPSPNHELISKLRKWEADRNSAD